MSETPKHSGLGITAFILSLVTALVTAGLFGVASILESATPGGIDEESPAAITIGLLLVLSLASCVVSFALGIAGLVQANRNKSFAILGTIISALVGIGASLTILLGLLVS
jgi:hypothetical protein